MKKTWFQGLALALGLVSSTAVAQYPANYDSFGASAYPVQTQSILQNLPQVPQNYTIQPQAQVAQPQVAQAPLAQTAVAQAPVSQLPVAQAMAAPATVPALQTVAYPQAGYQVAPVANTTVPVQQVYQPAGQYQLVGVQGQPYDNSLPIIQDSVPVQPAAPVPAVQPIAPPSAPSAPITGTHAQAVPGAVGCQSCGPTGQAYAAPAAGYYATSCGTAPVSGYAGHGHRRNLLCGLPNCARPWFFGAGALVFNRVDNTAVPLSFEDAAYAPDILDTNDARMSAAIGFEATAGRYFNCGRNAIAATYWGIFPDDVQAVRARATAGDYRSRIPFTYMQMAGTPAAPATPYDVYDWYDNAYTHALTRTFEYHNFEVNLLGFAVGCSARNFNRAGCCSMFSGLKGKSCGSCGGAGCSGCASAGCASAGCGSNCCTKLGTGPCCLTPPACGSRLNVTWLAGFRFFRFNDNLLYASSLDDTAINRAADDLYYQVDTSNTLFGGQLGARLDYCVLKRINLYSAIKVGVFNNRSNLYTRLGTDFDNAYLNDTRTPANPDNGVDYLFDVSQDQIALLGEYGLGFGVRCTCNWTATFGYRVVAVSGVATAPDNVRTSFAHYSDVRDYDNNGTLILHGFNAGAVYNF